MAGEDGSKVFRLKFSGEGVASGRIPARALSDLSAGIIRLAADIAKARGEKSQNIDFDIELNEGSTEVAWHSRGQPVKGAPLTEDLAGVWTGTLWNRPYAEKLDRESVEEHVGEVMSAVDGWAEDAKVYLDDEELATVEVSSSEEESTEDDLPPHERLVGFLYSMHTLQNHFYIRLQDGSNRRFKFNTGEEREQLSPLHRYLYLRVENFPGERKASKLMLILDDLKYEASKLSEVPEHQAIEGRLAEFEELSQNGWNGYDAEPITSDVIDQARKHLAFYYQFCIQNDLEWESPFIVPVPNGHIQFEWNTEHWYLEIEFDESESFFCLIKNKDNGAIERNRFEDVENTLNYLIRVFYRGTL